MRPGFDVVLRDERVPRAAPTAVDTWFAVGITEKGKMEPHLCRSLDDFTDEFGEEISTSNLPATVREAFHEGLARLYVKRVVGPDAVTATKSFNDVTPAATLAIDAKSPGAWGNGLKAAITNTGAAFTITITNSDNETLQVSPSFATKAEAVTWALDSDYIRVRSLAPNTLPVTAAATALLTGDDDTDGVGNTQYENGLAAFSRTLGPGQVSVPGATSSAVHALVLAHAASSNRRGILDAPDSADDAVVIAAAAALDANANTRFGAMFGPWDVVPGRLSGTTATVPPCGRVAGTIARMDAQGNPNAPAAGDNGRSVRVLSLTQTYTDDEYEDINEAGVNMSRTLFGDDVQIYGFRTLVDPDDDPRWVEFSGSRTVMYVTAHANRVMSGFAFDQIDGEGHKFAELGGAITGILLPLHSPVGALYGATPQEAFSVDTSAAVNTPERVQNRELHAVVSLKTSPFAERVVTEIVRRLVTEEV